MTPEAQRIAIAEACGWTGDQLDKVDDLGPIKGYKETRWWHEKYSMWPRKHYLLPTEPPNYLNDLNAMHEAEKVLDGAAARFRYAEILHGIVKRDGSSHIWHAAAAQRAEAFLKTLNLCAE